MLMYFFVLSQKPFLVIISLLSALFYIVSLLITSLIMYPIPAGSTGSMDPTVGETDVVYSVAAVTVGSISQEFSRFAFIYVFRKVDRGFKSVLNSAATPKSIIVQDSSICLASGMGIATAHMLTTAGFVLAATIPRAGDYFAQMCGDTPLQYLTAMTALGFFILDILLMIIAFRAEKHKSIVHLLFVFCAHLAAGFCTISNFTLRTDTNSDCMASVYSVLAVVVVTFAYVVMVPDEIGIV